MSGKQAPGILCALLLVAFCGAAIRAAGDPQAGADRKPKFALQSIAFKGVDPGKKTAELMATVAVKNAGGAFRLQDVTYRLKLNDTEVAEGRYEKDLEIPASGEAVFALPFTVDMTSIPGVAWNLVSDSFTVRYELEAEFAIPLFGALKHRQKAGFTGDISIGEAFSSLSGRWKEKIFGKP